MRELPQLGAVFDVARRGAGVRVIGQVRALVGQTCVVTLDPIESEVMESVDVSFAPSQDADAVESGPTKKGKEPPEPLLDGVLDLGALAAEFLILGLDPYPRKAGAKFVAPKAEGASGHPFAALEALKKRSGSERK
ncbi:MAG: YceD family protein [Pseudolabrys sp.]